MYSEAHIQLPEASGNVIQHIYLKVENTVYGMLNQCDFGQTVESILECRTESPLRPPERETAYQADL